MGIVLGDVAGKGMGAALLMAALQATLHARLDQGGEISTLVRRLSETIARDAPSNRFVTFFLAVLDTATHTAACINAGHAPAPVLLRESGEIVRLESGGPPLGIDPAYRYGITELVIEPGDLLFACTDGVTELYDREGGMFGDEALMGFLQGCSGKDPEMVRRELTSSLERFSEGAERSDDLTMVVLRRD